MIGFTVSKTAPSYMLAKRAWRFNGLTKIVFLAFY